MRGAHTVMSVSCGHLHTVTLIPAQSRGQDCLFFLGLGTFAPTAAAAVD